MLYEKQEAKENRNKQKETNAWEKNQNSVSAEETVKEKKRIYVWTKYCYSHSQNETEIQSCSVCMACLCCMMIKARRWDEDRIFFK